MDDFLFDVVFFILERLGTLALAAYRKTLDDNMLLSHFLSRPIFNFDSFLHSDSPIY